MWPKYWRLYIVRKCKVSWGETICSFLSYFPTTKTLMLINLFQSHNLTTGLYRKSKWVGNTTMYIVSSFHFKHHNYLEMSSGIAFIQSFIHLLLRKPRTNLYAGHTANQWWSSELISFWLAHSNVQWHPRLATFLWGPMQKKASEVLVPNVLRKF